MMQSIISISLCLTLFFLTCEESRAQSVRLYNDSTVLIGLKQYRAVRERVQLGDSLINSLKTEIQKVSDLNKALRDKENATHQLLKFEQERNKELSMSIRNLLGQLDEATKKRWYQRPELYLVSGIVLGVIATR